MKNPQRTVKLDGQNLTIDKVISVSHYHAKVLLDKKALQRMEASRQFVKAQAEANKIVYGVTTGFGPNADAIVLGKKSIELQRNLLISHATGVGELFSIKMTRAIMLIRMNTILAGYSGIRKNVVIYLQKLLNKRIYPTIPEQGSVGSSGDLAPLSHMALPLLGVGEMMMEWNDNTSSKLKKQLNRFVKIKNIDGVEVAVLPAEKLLKAFGIKPLELSYKEGLAMNNGTSVMAALGVQGVYEAKQLMQLGTLSASLSFEGLCARAAAYDSRVHRVRNHKEQAMIASNIRAFTKGSDMFNVSTMSLLKTLRNVENKLKKEKIEASKESIYQKIFQIQKELKAYTLQDMLKEKNLKVFLEKKPQQFCDFLSDEFLKQETYKEDGEVKKMPHWMSWKGLVEFAKRKITPQDSYSVRCLPQIFGASLKAIHYVEETIQGELNAVVDNPIVFSDGKKGTVISAGNFHGQPLALVLDHLKLAVAEMGNVLERQINKLVDKNHNEVLPAFLVEKAGLHSGLMIPQYTAAGLVSENKVLVHPASADSIPTSANQEDHNSMGTIAGRQALEIISNVEKILSIHLLTAAQAVQMRQKQFKKAGLSTQLATPTNQLLKAIKKCGVDYISEDRLIKKDMDLILENMNDFYTLTVEFN